MTTPINGNNQPLYLQLFICKRINISRNGDNILSIYSKQSLIKLFNNVCNIFMLCSCFYATKCNNYIFHISCKCFVIINSYTRINCYVSNNYRCKKKNKTLV